MRRYVALLVAVIFVLGSACATVAFHHQRQSGPRLHGAQLAARSVHLLRPASDRASRGESRQPLVDELAQLRRARVRALRAHLKHQRRVLVARRARRAAAERARHLAALVSSDSHVWATQPYAEQVSYCESSGNIRAVNGQYLGKWQMDASFWSTYGGLRFASSPLGATEAQQDQVAWTGWKARGWEPWQCAGGA